MVCGLNMSENQTRPISISRNLLQQGLLTLLASLALFSFLALAAIVGFEVWNSGRIYPGVSISGVDLSGLKPAAASERLAQVVSFSQTGRLLFEDGNLIWQATPAQLGFSMDANLDAQIAYQIGRQDNLVQNLITQFNSWTYGIDLPPTIVYDQKVAQDFLLSLAKQIDKPVIEAKLGLNGIEVNVHSGQIGRSLDVPATLALVEVELQTLQDSIVPLVIHETPPVILDATQQADIAEAILSQPLILTLPDGQSGTGPWQFDPETLANMLTINIVQSPDGVSNYQVGIDASLMRTFLNNLAPDLAVTPENARFTFNDTTKLIEVIQNAVTGQSLNVDATIDAINQGLVEGQHTIPLVFDTIQPAVTDSSTGEELGVTQLVQSTTTYFYGSDSARVQNITAAASRFHGLLVAPGETFSMSDVLGDISLDNGYAEALIIYGDQTIKGVGGGVCQVSTTLFRTVFFAGYPITERHPHAYRVGYYEQKSNATHDPNLAGLDATVFVPLVDFKFVNDTPYWLLMETYVNGYSLTWKIYSTSDGRTVDWQTTGPQNPVDPPDPLYTENPELAEGVIKQVDWSAEGADITINRTVYRDGSVYFQDSFTTHYEAWQAKYEYGPGTTIPTPSPTDAP
jgi:vancomycin resistance protein YoaR